MLAFVNSTLNRPKNVPRISISDLPDDIIDLILGNLSHFRDFQSCSLLDRRWLPHAQSRLFTTFECLTHNFTCTVYCNSKAEKLQCIVLDSPHIARYFRSLRVDLSLVSRELCYEDAVSFLLPQMTNLREIKLVCYAPQSQRLDWKTLAKPYADLFLQCFRQSVLCHISIEGVENFPALVLDQVPFLISLRLHRVSLSPVPEIAGGEGQSASTASTSTPTSVLPLESFHFRSCDEGGRTASLLLRRLEGPDAGIFGRLRRLCFVVARQEEALLVKILRGCAFSLRDLVLDVEAPTKELYAAFQNLTSLESLVIKFYDITDIGQVPKDCAHLLRSLGKAGCPLRKLHLLMVPRVHSASFQAVHESAWNELDLAILHWVRWGTLRSVCVGSTGLYYGKGTTATIKEYLSGVANADILNVASAG